MKRRKAFTLVELLVVIGIIAVLVGILMPSLNKARRQARSVQCLANLRTIGHAFFMYSQTFKGVWPVAVHANGAWLPLPPGIERRWYDLVGEYVTSKTVMSSMADIEAVRQNSVMWGCPEWSRTEVYEVSGDKYRPGYGMQYYPTYFDDGKLGKNLAYVNGTNGRYLKQVEWRRPSERGLLADSQTHIINVGAAAQPITMASKWHPYPPSNVGAVDFGVDGARHAGNSVTKQQTYRGRFLNMLFCDGHAETVSVAEAWNAIVNPGFDKAGN